LRVFARKPQIIPVIPTGIRLHAAIAERLLSA